MIRMAVVAALASGIWALLPGEVAACAVCFSAKEESRQAFLATTALLTLLPLGMVGGAGMWLRSRARRADEEDIAGPEHVEH